MVIQEIAVSIVRTIAEKCVDPILRQLQYIFCYKTKVQTWKDRIEELERKKAEVQRLVEAARKNDEVIKTPVTTWLKQVDDQKTEEDTILQGLENAKMSCFNVRLPNLKLRYLLGRHATKGASVVEKLLGERKFDEVGYIAPLGKMLLSKPNPSLEEGLVTRMSKKKEVMEALKQEKTSLVAICGMPGIGKTTLVKQIFDQVKSGELFKDVAMAIVSQTPDMRNVQNQLAEQLGLTISEQVDHFRAERMYNRLTNSDKRTLVILDDVWKEVDFTSLGIPVKGECKSLKVIMTSRFSDRCRNMGAVIVEVDALLEEEALHLFKEEVGISDDSILNAVAKQVVRECKGLPLAIIVVARVFSSIDRTPESWNQTLKQLQEYTIGDVEQVKYEVFPRIKFSYDYLKNDEAKSLLLLCSLFPEDYSIPIECLVRYGKGLGWFQYRRSLEDVRYKVDILIGHLKSSYLLLNDGEQENCVKLHDVVRDFCLSIAPEAGHEFLVSSAGVEERNSYTAISLTSQDSNHDLLPFCREYPRLTLLRLVIQSGKLNLPKDSFVGMGTLRVMELNNSRIEFSLSWPDQMLRSLRTLCLDYCKLGTGMSSMLGHMTQLENLSLFKSKIQDDQFPTEVAWPSNLKLLDLRVESSPHPLPGGILSSLKKLEELYLGSHCHLQLGKDEEEKRGYLKEISSISHLACLQIDLYDLDLLFLLLQEFDTQRLVRFHIAVANYGRGMTDFSKNYQFRKSFELYLSDDEALDDKPLKQVSSSDDGPLKQVFDPKVISIVKRTENLTLNLSESSCLMNLMPDLEENGFINLKKLDLYRGQYECLIDSTTKLVAQHVFENLESMKLRGLKLKEICNGPLPSRCFNQLQEVELNGISALEYLWKGPVEPPSFCNLRSIYVRKCDQMTTLFSQWTLKCLVQLQRIRVYDCKTLESIVLREESLKEEVLELPQLKVLFLHKTNLMGFGSKDDKGGALFDQVSLPRLERLRICDPGDGLEQLIGGKMPSGSLDSLEHVNLSRSDSIRCIAKADTVTLLQNLQALEACKCSEMEFLIDFEGLKVPNAPSKKGLEILPKLESLFLYECPRLTHIWRNFSDGVRVFQNLRSLEVYYCPLLNCLFYPPCVASMLVSLERLEVMDCQKMHGVIGGEEDEEVSQEDNAQQHDDVGKHREIAPERTNKEFVFPKLRYLFLSHIENLRSFGSSHQEDCEFKFLQLTGLTIVNCPKLKKFRSGNLDAPLLKKVKTEPIDLENFEAPMDLKDREICSYYE